MDDCFVLTAVTIQGVTLYPLADLAPTYEDKLARRVGVQDLVAIAAAITDRYRRDGYFLTRAVVAPYDGDAGAATIVVYEGYVQEVVVEGSGAAGVRPLLAPLTARRPLRIRELDRRLALASDQAGVKLTNRIEPVLGNPSAHRLVVEADLRRFSGAAYLENRGSEAQGPWQVYLTGSANSVLRAGDQFTLSTLVTPDRLEELVFAEGAYSAPLGDGRRLQLALSGYTTNAPPTTTNGWLNGRSAAASISVAQPLIRSRQQNLWLNAGVDVRHVEQTYRAIGLSDEDLTVFRLSLSGRQVIDGGYLSGTLRLSQGLDVLNATDRIAPNLTRNDADSLFTKVNLNLSGYRDIGRFAGIYGEVAGQWSDDPLLNSEEFAVGGATFGRAYNYGEVSGDKGIAAMVEFRVGWDPAPAYVRFLQLFAFYDIASVWNYRLGGGRSDELSSAGAGMRVSLAGQTALKVELAKPLDRTPYTEPDRDWRTFVSLSRQF